MAPAWAASRAHSTVRWRRLATAASAVPQLPAPSTATLSGAGGEVMGRPVGLLAGGTRRQDDAGVVAVGAALLLLLGQFGQALLVQGLEVHFGQVQGRQRGAGDGVGHVGA